MQTTNLFFIVRHLGELKHVTLGQWLSVAGAAVSAFGVALASAPHHYDLAAEAAAGTALVAVVHLLQPSPIKVPDAKTDSEGRTHL